jgi:ABC-type spermidine/putrescine transport system permease subunit II
LKRVNCGGNRTFRLGAFDFIHQSRGRGVADGIVAGNRGRAGDERRRFAGYALVEAVLMLPLVLPPVVTGYVLLLLIGRQGLIGSWLESTWGWRLIFTPYAAVLASAVVAFPLMYQSAKAGFDNIDPHLLDAARSLGANSMREFWTVVVPLTVLHWWRAPCCLLRGLWVNSAPR